MNAENVSFDQNSSYVATSESSFYIILGAITFYSDRLTRGRYATSDEYDLVKSFFFVHL